MSEPTGKSPSPRRLIAVGIAVLIPIVPIVIALIVFSGGSNTVTVTQTAPSASAASQGSGNAAGTTKAAAPVNPIPQGRGALVAYVPKQTGVYSKPGGHKIASLKAKTTFGSPVWVLVHQVKHHWLGIINNVVGNNKIGWIKESAAGAYKRVLWRIQVRLAQHLLTVYYDGKAYQRWPISTGESSAPTPPGHFAVTDRLTTGDPSGPYGCCILGTSAQAPHHISDWDGGNRIAIHSTPPDTYWGIGESISHGCMHVTLPEGRYLLKHIPLGTPVNISSA